MKTISTEIKERACNSNESNQIGQVYTVSEIQKILKISRAMSYELVNSGSFPIIKIGRSIRIPVKTFQDWIYSNACVAS